MKRSVRWGGWWLLVLCWVGLVPLLASAAPAPQGAGAQRPATQRPGAQQPAKPAADATPSSKATPEATPSEGQGPADEAKPAGETKPGGEAKPAGATKPAQPASKAPGAPGSGSDPFAAAPDVRQSEIYGDRLDGLQAEVEDLKDRIFRSKARLSLLKETVLRGVLGGSRVVLAHRNLMGSGFKLVRIVYAMDGAQIYARTDESGGLDSEDELVIYDGNLPPGPHNVTIELMYKGHGYGIFSYLTQYTFTSTGSHSFTAPENGAVKLTSVGFESGNITTEMRDRPNVQWQELPLDASGRPLPTTRTRKRTPSGR
jgi:hypothetical protein